MKFLIKLTYFLPFLSQMKQMSSFIKFWLEFKIIDTNLNNLNETVKDVPKCNSNKRSILKTFSWHYWGYNIVFVHLTLLFKALRIWIVLFLYCLILNTWDRNLNGFEGLLDDSNMSNLPTVWTDLIRQSLMSVWVLLHCWQSGCIPPQSSVGRILQLEFLHWNVCLFKNRHKNLDCTCRL